MSENKLQHMHLSLNSDQRTYGDDNSWTILLKRPIHRIKKMKIEHVSFALTHYVFNSTNNKVYINESVGDTDIIGTITPGNYNNSTLETELKSILETASVSGGNSFTYTVSIDTSTFLMTISVSSGNITLSVGGSNDASATLGFSVDSATSTSITGDESIRLAGENTFILRSNIAHLQNVSQFSLNGDPDNDCLLAIPLTVNTGQLQRYDNRRSPYVDVHGDLYDLSFRLTHSNNNTTIDLNGSPMNVVLSLWIDHPSSQN
jgi:hypothetical protein